MKATDIEVEIRRYVTVFPNEFRVFVFIDGDVNILSIEEAKELHHKLADALDDVEPDAEIVTA